MKEFKIRCRYCQHSQANTGLTCEYNKNGNCLDRGIPTGMYVVENYDVKFVNKINGYGIEYSYSFFKPSIKYLKAIGIQKNPLCKFSDKDFEI